MKTFDQHFNEFYPKIQSIARHFGRTTPIAADEYESLLCEKFFTRFDEFDVTRSESGLHSFMYSILKQEAIRFSQRKERQFHDTMSNLDELLDGSEGDDFSRELLSSVDVEEEVTDKIFVSQVLSHIKNEKTHEILSIFFDAPDISFRELGRAVGLDHKTVKARIAQVAKREVIT